MTEWTRDHWFATCVLIVLLSAMVTTTIVEVARAFGRKR